MHHSGMLRHSCKISYPCAGAGNCGLPAADCEYCSAAAAFLPSYGPPRLQCGSAKKSCKVSDSHGRLTLIAMKASSESFVRCTVEFLAFGPSQLLLLLFPVTVFCNWSLMHASLPAIPTVPLVILTCRNGWNFL